MNNEGNTLSMLKNSHGSRVGRTRDYTVFRESLRKHIEEKMPRV